MVLLLITEYNKAPFFFHPFSSHSDLRFQRETTFEKKKYLQGQVSSAVRAVSVPPYAFGGLTVRSGTSWTYSIFHLLDRVVSSRLRRLLPAYVIYLKAKIIWYNYIINTLKTSIKKEKNGRHKNGFNIYSQSANLLTKRTPVVRFIYNTCEQPVVQLFDCLNTATITK